ncbi:MAG: outer membrane protein assembly factor BamB [Blastocatellia bacterium]|jgi:outer membrane protein assembly factor BamB|nr:outer membrane protein assembly factor BamB [Blastocatellia bacterium]
MFGIMGGAICGLAVILWWLLFSRAPWIERIGAIVLLILAVVIFKRMVHPSIAGGMMGMMLPVFSLPFTCLALVASATIGRGLAAGPRRALMAAAILLACGGFMLIRTGGITADAKSDLHWRWTKTPEELLLAKAGGEPTTPLANAPVGVVATNAAGDAGWPGFRGANRDSVSHGPRIETDWASQPPKEVWRRPIGPGWSSFAVRDNLFYTQEQRGNDEVVSCYNLGTGQPVWLHKDGVRFYESNAGAGPRGTPTLSNGRVYTLGATGILNALDARTGSVVWSHNAASDTNTKVPGWGFASSPLVVGDVVIVATAGALAAYDLATGNQRWLGPATARGGYSSPHLATIGGVAQVMLVNGEGVMSVNPSDGAVLWKYAWEGDSIVQPAVTADGDVLLGSGSGLGSEVGVLRLAVEHGSGGWTAKERWNSAGLKPYFNDFVIHKDLAFGFDGSNLACIDLKTGAPKWKGERYGHGQIVLLADQDVLLVISEEGDLALVKAVPEQFTELGRFKAIAGKTWNHPVLTGDLLLVRNGEEMAAFRLALPKG